MLCIAVTVEVIVAEVVSVLFEGSEAVPALALITVSFWIFVAHKGNGIWFAIPR